MTEQLIDRELTAKYRALTVPLIGFQRSALIEAAVAGLAADDGTLEELLSDLTSPLAREAHRLDAIPGAA